MTVEDEVRVYVIAAEMSGAGLASEDVVTFAEAAKRDPGCFDLMTMWKTTETEEDRASIVDDLREVICTTPRLDPQEGSVKSTHAEQLGQRFTSAADFMSKEQLRLLVHAKGGVSHVARLAGMSQSSLSRFLWKASSRRSVTYLRLCQVLGFPENDVRQLQV